MKSSSRVTIGNGYGVTNNDSPNTNSATSMIPPPSVSFELSMELPD